MQPNPHDVDRIIRAALEEDIGEGDITSQLLLPADMMATLAIVAREELVGCGVETVAAKVFAELSPMAECEAVCKDGEIAKPGDVLATIHGPAQVLLTGERTALNLLQRMSGVATLTSQYVKAAKSTSATIIDTRKTIPGLRELDKYAVRSGGGTNHRMRLDDMVLIKDNHIALAGGVEGAVQKAVRGAPTGRPLVGESETEQTEGVGRELVLINLTRCR